MAKAIRRCVRCERLRYEDRMKEGKCVHGTYWICLARTSCKNAGREQRRQARAAAPTERETP